MKVMETFVLAGFFGMPALLLVLGADAAVRGVRGSDNALLAVGVLTWLMACWLIAFTALSVDWSAVIA